MAGVPRPAGSPGEGRRGRVVELLDAFDVEVSYDKPAAQVGAERALAMTSFDGPKAKRPPKGGRGIPVIAGAGFEPPTFGL